MKSYQKKFLCIPTMLMILLMLFEHKIIVVMAKRKQDSSLRQQQSDSILEIMNAKEIRRLLAERRLNVSYEDSGLFLENDLAEVDLTETPLASTSYSSIMEGNRYHSKQHQHHQERITKFQQGSKENPFDFATSTNNEYQSGNRLNSSAGKNSSIGDFNLNLPNIRGDKLLKSSKNALFITKKEYLKKDWCKTEPLMQRIREPGCLTRTFVNRFCYGQCNSFYIPKSPRKRRGNVPKEQFDDEDLTPPVFRSCGFCKPKKFTWITVTLRCPSLVPQLRKKRVQRIKQCKCMPEPLD